MAHKWYEWVFNPWGTTGQAIGEAIAKPIKEGIDASQASSGAGGALSAQDIANMTPLQRLGVSVDNYLLGTLDWSRQQEQNAFNAREAAIDRDWQQMMRQTYYQDAANSALAAGFNPAFAMSGSASSPSGAQAHASNSVSRPGVDYGRMLSNVFSVVGSLVSAGIKSSAMEAAQDIRGQYTIDAAKLRGNNALVISKNIADSAMKRQHEKQSHERYMQVIKDKAALDRVREKGYSNLAVAHRYTPDYELRYEEAKRALDEYRRPEKAEELAEIAKILKKIKVKKK